MSLSEKIAFESLIVALVSLFAGTAAVLIAWFGIHRANKTTSGSTYVVLHDAIRQSWERFFQTTDIQRQQSEIGEVLNLLEVACGLYVEKSLDGASRELMSDYLKNILTKLIQNRNAALLIEPLMQSEETFIYIKKFLNMKATSLSVTVPPMWYQLPHEP